MKKNRTRQTGSLRNKLIAFALACTAALALASCTQSAAADVGEQSARETAFAHAGVYVAERVTPNVGRMPSEECCRHVGNPGLVAGWAGRGGERRQGLQIVHKHRPSVGFQVRIL